MPDVFISYPEEYKHISENLRGRLAEFGIQAWTYSLDRTLAVDAWEEITERLRRCFIAIFIVSEHTINSEGQQRELEIAIKKINEAGSGFRMFPITVGSARFPSLPLELKHINGLHMDAYNVETTALRIAQRFLPDSLPTESPPDWRYPKPAQWLKVCNLDEIVEEYFRLGDEVYFRRISPLGLFECYAPQINGLFWFDPTNLRPVSYVDEGRTVERERVPREYRVSTMYDIERRGLEELQREGRIPSPGLS